MLHFFKSFLNYYLILLIFFFFKKEKKWIFIFVEYEHLHYVEYEYLYYVKYKHLFCVEYKHIRACTIWIFTTRRISIFISCQMWTSLMYQIWWMWTFMSRLIKCEYLRLIKCEHAFIVWLMWIFSIFHIYLLFFKFTQNNKDIFLCVYIYLFIFDFILYNISFKLFPSSFLFFLFLPFLQWSSDFNVDTLSHLVLEHVAPPPPSVSVVDPTEEPVNVTPPFFYPIWPVPSCRSTHFHSFPSLVCRPLSSQNPQHQCPFQRPPKGRQLL